MAGKGGGAWKVAYADFVTAMMAFFMVMWLTSQNEEVKNSVAQYFRDPFATTVGKPAGTGKVELSPNPLRQAKPAPQDVHDDTRLQSGRAITGPQSTEIRETAAGRQQFTVFFDELSATITPEEQRQIAESSRSLKGKLNRIEIRGHCLRKPLPEGSDYADHWELCYARCLAVKRELESHGIQPERLRLSQAEGNEPITHTAGPSVLRLNSRVDVFLLPDMAHQPWAEGDEPADVHGATEPAVEPAAH